MLSSFWYILTILTFSNAPYKLDMKKVQMKTSRPLPPQAGYIEKITRKLFFFENVFKVSRRQIFRGMRYFRQNVHFLQISRDRQKVTFLCFLRTKSWYFGHFIAGGGQAARARVCARVSAGFRPPMKNSLKTIMLVGRSTYFWVKNRPKKGPKERISGWCSPICWF